MVFQWVGGWVGGGGVLYLFEGSAVSTTLGCGKMGVVLVAD